MALPVVRSRVLNALRNSQILTRPSAKCAPVTHQFACSGLIGGVAKNQCSAYHIFRGLAARPPFGNVSHVNRSSVLQRFSLRQRRWQGTSEQKTRSDEAAQQAKYMRWSFIAFGATFSICGTLLICEWGECRAAAIVSDVIARILLHRATVCV